MSTKDFASTAGAQWEPTPEQVERIAREFYADAKMAFPYWGNINSFDSLDAKWRDLFTGQATRILNRQHERETGLKYAMERAIKSLEANFDHPSWAVAYLKDALAAHAALDAPPEPTLLEAAKALVGRFNWVADSANVEALDALKAAVERAEKERAK